MVVFNFWSNSSSKVVDVIVEDPNSPASPQSKAKTTAVADVVVEAGFGMAAAGQSAVSLGPQTGTKPLISPPPIRRSFDLFQNRSAHDLHKPMLSIDEQHKKERRAVLDFKHTALSRSLSSSSDKRARECADIVRLLIVGPPSISPVVKKTKPFSNAELNRVKSELSKPRSANKVIAHLRQIDLNSDSPSSTSAKLLSTKLPSRPIHAVCLNASDEEVGKLHFARLKADRDLDSKKNEDGYPSVVNATMESVASMFSELNIVSLMSSDFGLGQPGDGEGILAGAVPTAETIIKGVELITPELMSLGFATGKAIIPDHTGVYPPTDRISVLTYWWGLEVLLPSPTLKYLGDVQSVSHTVLNFLTALATVNNGVREILPFIRYISQFIEFELNSIKGQNHGQGVVCAATWLMPAALVPRPWDFEPKPAAPLQPASEEDPVLLAPSDETTTIPPKEPPVVIRPVDPSVGNPEASIL